MDPNHDGEDQEAEFVGLLDQSHHNRFVEVTPSDACDAGLADVRSIQMEDKLECPLTY